MKKRKKVVRPKKCCGEKKSMHGKEKKNLKKKVSKKYTYHKMKG
jgi:hypothetical protein